MCAQTKTHIPIFGAVLTIIEGCIGLAYGLYFGEYARYLGEASLSWPTSASPVVAFYAIEMLGIFVFVSGLIGA
jgi:hypothetical protein